MTTTNDILILQCCGCGAKLEVEQDDGDCEDDEVECPKCKTYTPMNANHIIGSK
jgi:hypothetical protein